jgi:cytochrome oxidase Cu insertion factor (SCO1/SenC/PrrC family)
MSAMKPKIHFRVAKDGNVTLVDVTGAGDQCQNITASMEKAIGKVDEKSREDTMAANIDINPLKLTIEGQ